MALTMQYAAVAVGAVVGVVLAELLRVGALPSLLMTAAGGIVGARVAQTIRSRRQRQEQEDDARTMRLVDALDAAAEIDPRMQFEHDDTFEAIVARALCDGAYVAYPPPGHSYPREAA